MIDRDRLSAGPQTGIRWIAINPAYVATPAQSPARRAIHNVAYALSPEFLVSHIPSLRAYPLFNDKYLP